MLELVFVIVVLGILAKFGVDLFMQIYENYARTTIASDLMSKSEAAIGEIANRLNYRIKDSAIASTGAADVNFTSLTSADSDDNVFEWIGQDNDGWDDGDYSGIIDLNHPATTKSQLISPATTSLPGQGALLFMGSKVDVKNSFGWHGSAVNDLYEYNTTTSNVIPMKTPFTSGDEIFEFYQVAGSAYALVLDTTDAADHKLYFYKNYYPWSGQTYTDNNNERFLLVDHVSTFNLQKAGDIIRIELCLSSNNYMGEDYSICKTKIVF